jgi:translation initiation factor 1 (eIF-1/SUI1)
MKYHHLLLLVTQALQHECLHSFIVNKRDFRHKNDIRLSAKQKIKINTNISGDISSDGLLADKKQEQKERTAARAAIKSNLGVSTKKKRVTEKVPSSKKADKLAKQRNGSVDSRFQAGLAVPEDQQVQVQVQTRGNKKVTLIRGLTSPMEDRKNLLKELRKSLGGGGTMVEGVVSYFNLYLSSLST